tara:strand:+ start:3425 stop:3778 length:354 start_codon:yes stop_codon:yes gene_type:complete
MKLSLLDNGIWDIMNSWNDLTVTNGRYTAPENYWSETSEGYSCKMNMAGIKKENIKVLVQDGILTVSAKQDNHTYRSKAYIPKKADATNSIVKYEDGMLYLEFKKLEGHKSIELEIT